VSLVAFNKIWEYIPKYLKQVTAASLLIWSPYDTPVGQALWPGGLCNGYGRQKSIFK
jgi:hypothetical protein